MDLKKISKITAVLPYILFTYLMFWFIGMWLNVMTSFDSNIMRIFAYIWILPFAYILFFINKVVPYLYTSEKFHRKALPFSNPILNIAIHILTIIFFISFFTSILEMSNYIKSVNPDIEQAVNQYYIFGLSILFSFFFAYIAKRRKNNLSRT
ncbi:hypothetical protein KKA15_07030, partial [Patescibacteria group bacterium]|nr:hypothetical protein [Patescibacteria group bacterium]